MPTPTDPAVSGHAWSPTADPAADWWNQRVHFDGRPTRRVDVAAVLTRTPGMTEAAARAALETAPVADGRTAPRPPWYWDGRVYFDGAPVTRRAARAAMAATGVPEAAIGAYLDTAVAFGDGGGLDPEGRWVSVAGGHAHLTKNGKIVSGGPPAAPAPSAAPQDGKPESPEDKAYRKSVTEGVKADRRHQGTVDRLAAGKKVNDARLKAAHDHFQKSHGWHQEDLKAASGTDGKPLPGKEFDHSFHKKQADRIGNNLKVTTGAVQKRDKRAFRASAVKAHRKATKEDARHGATVAAVQAGEPVSRKAIRAAHDHYKGQGDFHGDLLSRLAGEKGENLLKIPHAQHADLMNRIIDAHGKQEVLKGAMDAPEGAPNKRAAKAVKDTKVVKDTKGEKATAVQEPVVDKAETLVTGKKKVPGAAPKAPAPASAEPGAAADAPAAKAMPAHEIRNKLQKALAETKAVGGDAIAPMSRFLATAQEHVPGLTIDQFHEHVKALEKSGHLELHEHDNPSKLTAAERAAGLASGNRLKFFASSRSGHQPWAHSEHDGAADAAHRAIQAGRANAAPPSRADVFGTLAHHGTMSGAAAGAAAREIHGKLARAGDVSQAEVRAAVARHASPDAQQRHAATATAAGTPGTNHAAGAALSTLYEQKTGRPGHAPGGVGKHELPPKSEVAAHIQTATHGRLAGRGAAKAAREVHRHVLAHGHDFMSGHDFADALDRHAKHDYRHSAPEDVAAAVKGGAAVPARHLTRAQTEAAGRYQKVNAARQRLLDRAGGDAGTLTGTARTRYAKLTGRVATHGDHIDAINDALIRHREAGVKPRGDKTPPPSP